MYRFDESYQETFALADGSEVTIRRIRPTDKAAIQDGFRRLSPHARYERFMGLKEELTDLDLEYFTEFDGVDHYAVGVLFKGPPGPPRGVGAARFVRIDGTDMAEPAVTVVDEFQGKGLGTLLLDHLSAAAWERGIRRFHLELFAHNVGMKRLIESVSHDHATFTHDGPETIMAEFRLYEPSPPEADAVAHPIQSVLGHIARADVTHLRRSTLPPPPPAKPSKP